MTKCRARGNLTDAALMLEELQQVTKSIGLLIFKGNTKQMANLILWVSMQLDTEAVEEVNEYSYLEDQIKIVRSNQVEELNRRIGLE